MVMISPLIHSHSSYNVHNDHLNRTLERALDEAVRTGELILSARKLHEFSNVNETCDLSDTTHADLSRNHLTEFPLILCSFYSLERLNLYHNAIKSIPEQINKIYLVKIIDLSRNQLTSIPSALCELPFLEVLILNNNKILSLPEEIGQTERLIELDVSTNELKRLPSQIGRLSSLRILNVRRNQLVELPFELCQLKLTHFDCSFNRLTCLPLNLREMISLIDLNVEQNPLKCPPSSICSLGILHIMRYLLVEAIKGEKQRGVLTEHEINTKYRNSFSYQGSRRSKCDRKVVVQSDSGYLTTENSEKADDSIVSMSNDQPISGDPTFMLSLADEFSKELARQKAEYERKKVQAQHLKRHLLQRLGESESQRMKTREIARRMHDEKFEKIEKQRQDARRKLENSKNLQIFHYSPKIDEKKRPTHRAASVEMKMPREMKEKNGVDFGFRCDRHRRISVEENSSLTRRNLLQAKEENLLVEQMRKMIENRLKVTLSDDLCSAFNDGVVLCHFINQIRAGSVQTIHVPSPAVPKVSLAKCRRNVENFLQASSRLGVPQINLCSTEDIIKGKNLVHLARQIHFLIANQFSQQTSV